MNWSWDVYAQLFKTKDTIVSFLVQRGPIPIVSVKYFIFILIEWMCCFAFLSRIFQSFHAVENQGVPYQLWHKASVFRSHSDDTKGATYDKQGLSNVDMSEICKFWSYRLITLHNRINTMHPVCNYSHEGLHVNR